uniref:Integrator complex subunit 9 n=1 Tax=Hirondellea gigas TaxID=1518452 RepID=A0A2P2I300_9CRUS
MKFYNLSSEPNRPSSIISFKDTTIMLDCCLEQTPTQHFLPLQLVPNQRTNNMNHWLPRDADTHLEGELRECSNRVFVDSPPEFKCPVGQLVDFSELDAILVSNSLSILALPYITNQTGFRGTVLMTEPTLQLGRLLMKELVEYVERCPKARVCSKWKQCLRLLPPPLSFAKLPQAWKQIYNSKQITEALSYVTIVAYNEPVSICGAVTATAVCSGYSVGSCNWLIASHQHKIVYLSASSSLTTHPRPLNYQPLKQPDVLIVSSLIHRPLTNPDHMMNEFCGAAVHALRNNGNVLVPCYPTGLIYDMMECLVSQLDSVNSSMVPIYFLSPVADQSLAYSNIFSEWLSYAKQNKVFQQEDPFVHAHLARAGRIKPFKSLHADGFSAEFRQPCVVFCGHPSLRFGDAVHFMELWANNPLNVVIFTEAEFEFGDALAPFQPLAMRPIYCPIDTCINYTQAQKLLSELKATTVLMPATYTKPPALTPHRTDIKLETSPPALLYRDHSILHVPLERTVELASMSPELAASLTPVAVRAGLTAATITASLKHQDNTFTLQVVDDVSENRKDEKETKNGNKSKSKPGPSSVSVYPSRYPYGTLSVEDLMQGLSQAGMVDARLEEDAGGCIITVESEDAMLQIRDNSTHIITSRLETREKIRDLLLKCLSHI